MNETNEMRGLTSIRASAGSQIQIHFVKSPQFRVVHASGAWFGGDAERNLHLSFFNERAPIPKSVIVNLNSDGQIIGEDESKRDSKNGVIREMEVDVVMSLQALENFYAILGENLKVLRQITKTT